MLEKIGIGIDIIDTVRFKEKQVLPDKYHIKVVNKKKKTIKILHLWMTN
jgi:hypothetical protein